MSALAQQLLALPVVESVLLRLELAGGGDADAELRGLAASLADELLQHQRPNGSWHDDVFATCDALRMLRDLRAADAYASREPALAWLGSRLGEPGRFGEGCDGGARHAAGVCAHFLPPLCSPGHAGVDLGGARLPGGLVFGSDAEARVCAAAVAFRELVVGGRSGTALQLQRAALRRIASVTARAATAGLDAPAYASLLDALRHERSPADDAALDAAVRAVATRQRGEGSWPNGGEYVLDALSRACCVGIAATRAPLRRAADHIAWLRVSHSARGEPPQRLLVAWRTLRCVAEQPDG